MSVAARLRPQFWVWGVRVWGLRGMKLFHLVLLASVAGGGGDWLDSLGQPGRDQLPRQPPTQEMRKSERTQRRHLAVPDSSNVFT